MNIIYHHRTQGAGAEGVHIREVIKALRELGHQVDLLSPPGVDPFLNEKNAADKAKKISWKKRLILALPQACFELMEIGYNFWASPALRKMIAARRPDFIYERYAFFCKAGVKAARRYGIPLILEVNEISGIKRQRPQTMVSLCRRFEDDIFARADALIVVSHYLKNQLIERGVNRDKVFVIPNAVNIEHFDIKTDPEIIREKFHLQGKTVMMFIGMFSHWDRLELLLEVFKKVHEAQPAAHLVIVGEGVQRPGLEERARELGIHGYVTFTGEVARKEIPYFIAASDICTLSGSNPFGSPIALFEFMIMGKPVVVPKYGPIESVVTDGENGFLFDPDDREGYCRALAELAGDKDKRERYGANGRDRVLNNHRWVHNAQRIMEIYQKIVS